MENFPDPQSGNVRDIIARRVGLGSGKTYEKGRDVVVRIDKELATYDAHRYAEILRTQLNDQSITSAWEIIGTTFEKNVPATDGASVPANGTGVPFTENLLRSILDDLTDDQQVELVQALAHHSAELVY